MGAMLEMTGARPNTMLGKTRETNIRLHSL